MAYKIFNIIALFVIVGTIVASPIDRPTENVKNSLLKSIFDSMNNGHSNHRFLNGTLLNVEKVLAEDNPSIYNVSVLLVPDCDMCPLLRCHMLIKENSPLSNFMVDEQSKACYDYEEKEEPTRIDVDDKIIQDFVKEGIDKLGEYKPTDKPLVTSMVNATKENISDGTKYVIYFVIIDPTCVTSGISTTCSTQDDSLARLCTVIVEEKHKLKYTIRHFDATCEKEQHPLDMLIQSVKKNNIS